ncbi:glycerophosphodiester phosphodiesterase family protein [Naasia lichenicola]|uniref:glycerophosphodiester phosphodiesterase family protein n=1 Tax=Naasia lichenicola TaxID=2565933 RepID=UPI001E4FC439|nr:glycerophosphodiester phosphodiesterase family protein [Naasia lichenicola]
MIAHRGLALEHPENSIDAFRAALDAGATHLETDAHATRDGIAVLAHDRDLSRVTGDPRRVGDLTRAELRGIPRGGDGICTLFDALQTFPSARFNLDVKDPRAVPGVIDAIRRAGAEERVLVASFRTARRRKVARALGNVPTSASSEQIVPAVLGASLHLRPLTRVALRGVDAVQIPRSVLGLPTTSPTAIAAFHRAGVEVHVWTINDPAEIDELLELGVDGIVSDRCDLVFEAVKRFR